MPRHSSAKQSRPPRRCAFCGGGPISREHFWPEWAADLLPKGPGLTYDDMLFSNASFDEKLGLQRKYKRSGSVTTRRVKTVCKDCNSRWMSLREQAVRPILTRLATSEPTTLDEDQQLELARWVVMKLMASEADLRGEEVTLPNERREFMESGTIPSGTSIWIFRCGAPNWRATYQRFATQLILKTASPPTRLAGRKNVQQATFGFGDLLITSIFSRMPGFKMNMLFPAGAATALWPNAQREINWPHPISIRGDHADVIGDNLARLVRSGPITLRPRT